MAIDKQKSLKEANRIKDLLVKSTKLGLTDGDVSVREDKEDGGYTITILNGKLPSNSAGEGATPRNISDAIDKDFRDFRAKGWVFTQPIGGEFRVAVVDKTLKESTKFSFRDFLAESK